MFGNIARFLEVFSLYSKTTVLILSLSAQSRNPILEIFSTLPSRPAFSRKKLRISETQFFVLRPFFRNFLSFHINYPIKSTFNRKKWLCDFFLEEADDTMALSTMTEAAFEPTTFVLKAVRLTHSANSAQAFQMIALYRLCVEKIRS